MGLIIRGQDINAPGFTIQNFQDEPKFKLKPTDGKPRPNTWVRGIVLHTTRGIPGGKKHQPQVIKPNPGPNHKRDEKVALMWTFDERKAGAHLVADSDSSWVQTADLQETAAFHAGNVNMVTIGIEMYQEPDGSLYKSQLETVVRMVDFLTKTFRIQRQVHWPYKKHALARGLHHGTDIVGVYGHRDCSNNRGPGDPGDAIIEMLIDAGYQSFDFEENEDKEAWKHRQRLLNLLPDGVPGPKTAEELLKNGYKHGLWVSRPGD